VPAIPDGEADGVVTPFTTDCSVVPDDDDDDGDDVVVDDVVVESVAFSADFEESLPEHAARAIVVMRRRSVRDIIVGMALI
jgi:hypothetical protein